MANPATATTDALLPPAFTAQDEQLELATLSPTEIAKADADLRGITSGLAGIGIIEEGTEAEDRRTRHLCCLDSELAVIPDSQKAVYLQAVARCPEVVNDEHKIAFLEREGFNARLAAKRLVKYWELKLPVFGPEKCFLPLTLRGAMKDEVEGMLKYPFFQAMPVKDAAGRAIIFFDASRRDLSKYSTNSAMMALWFMVEVATEDPEVRKKGFILLGFSRNVERKHYDPALDRLVTTFWGVSPVACRSIHFCHPSKVAYYVLFPVVKFLIGRDNRLRTKVHYGSTEEVLRDLEWYCLSRTCLPSELGGDIVLDLEEWVKDRLEYEKANPTFDYFKNLPAFTAKDELKELTTLGPTEIAKAEADLHGITLGLRRNIRIEFIQNEGQRVGQIHCLDSELSKIPDSQKAVYLQAVSRCPEMVNDEHKLAFLEREGFHAELAAQRLARYWETKLSVFGPEKCFLPLTLHGAMKDEVAGMLEHCPFHVMPVKDTAGRAIIFFDPSRLDFSKYSSNSAIMALWYIVEAAAEDPEVENRGIVILSFCKNTERKHFDPALGRFITQGFMDVSPIVCRSIHDCHPSVITYILIYPVVKYLFGRELRLRLKVHYGTTEEVLRDLEGYCLPRDRLPSEIGGDVVLDLEKWLNIRSVLENRRQVSRYQEADKEADINSSRRATKRMRHESEQGTPNDASLPSIGSSILPTGNNVKISSGVHVTSQLVTSTCDKSSDVSGASFQDFQGDTPISAGGERIAHKRDSFYDSIMELPGIEDLGTDDSSLVNAGAGSSVDQSLDSKKKRIGRKPDPRMDRAVAAKLANPKMTSTEALLVGGFDFPRSLIGGPPDAVLDSDHVSLQQRRNQLSRRMRQERRKEH